jgi:uncharacterized membrane protein
MTILILGLILFLGIHSIRIFADPWRTIQTEKMGEQKWKGFCSLLALIGFILIIYGYGQSSPSYTIWSPPLWTWHITAALTLIAFILLAAAQVPKNGIKAKVKDPMVLGVKTWALAHLISNGSLAGMILFGSFLVWAILDFKSCRRRRSNSLSVPADRSLMMTIATYAIGITAWFIFAIYIHQILFGISPFGYFSH